MFTIRLRSALPTSPSLRQALARVRLDRLASTFSFALLASVSMAPASVEAADKLSATDARAIEKVIRDQLDAFGHDDANRAFGHASPEIQRQFGTPDNFMRMVRDNYEPVYRSGGVQFEHLKRVGGKWVQTVQMFDESGHVWRALFTMKRAPQGGDRSTWKVAGCQLVETSSIAV